MVPNRFCSPSPGIPMFLLISKSYRLVICCSLVSYRARFRHRYPISNTTIVCIHDTCIFGTPSVLWHSCCRGVCRRPCSLPLSGCSIGPPPSTLTQRSTTAPPSRTSASAARTTRTSSRRCRAAPTYTWAPRYSLTNSEEIIVIPATAININVISLILVLSV